MSKSAKAINLKICNGDNLKFSMSKSAKTIILKKCKGDNSKKNDFF